MKSALTGAVPADTTALIVIAIALSLQTLLMVGVAIWMAVTWRRAQAGFESQFQALVARADDTLEETRRAAEALHRISDQASTPARRGRS